MRKRGLPVFITTSIVVAAVLVTPSVATENPKAKSPNEKAIGFWTKDRLENALTREFQFEPGAKSAKLVSVRKSGGSAGGKNQTTVNGASWTKAGLPLTATGKVFFTMGAQTYVCSGAIVNDSKIDRSLVLTAGHCLFDNVTGLFATNFI